MKLKAAADITRSSSTIDNDNNDDDNNELLPPNLDSCKSDIMDV